MKDKMGKETEIYVQFLKERYAQDISMYDDSFLEKTIKCRLVATSCKTADDYLVYLGNVSDELTCLIDQLSNSYSEFFRNPLTFSMLEQTIIPKIFSEAAKNHSREIRIWSAGCASGQEPYSLAILFDDFKNNHQIDIIYRIFATDSTEEELTSAKNGNFDYKSLKKGGFLITGEAEIFFVNSHGSFRQYAIPAPIFVKN